MNSFINLVSSDIWFICSVGLIILGVSGLFLNGVLGCIKYL